MCVLLVGSRNQMNRKPTDENVEWGCVEVMGYVDVVRLLSVCCVGEPFRSE